MPRSSHLHKLPPELAQNVISNMDPRDRHQLAKVSPFLHAQVDDFHRHATYSSKFKHIPRPVMIRMLEHMKPKDRWKFGRTSKENQAVLKEFYMQQEASGTTAPWKPSEVAYMRNLIDFMHAILAMDKDAITILRDKRFKTSDLVEALDDAHIHYDKRYFWNWKPRLGNDQGNDHFYDQLRIFLWELSDSRHPHVNEVIYILFEIAAEWYELKNGEPDYSLEGIKFHNEIANIHKSNDLNYLSQFADVDPSVQMQRTIDESLRRKNYKLASKALVKKEWERVNDYLDEDDFDDTWRELNWPTAKRHYPKNIRRLIQDRTQQSKITDYFHPPYRSRRQSTSSASTVP